MREQDYPYTELESNTIQFYNPEDRCFRCPICNKVFYVRCADDYIYRLTNKHNKVRTMCSYTCKNKAKEELKNAHPDRRKKPIHYPQDFPINWIDIYNEWRSKAITKAEAIRIMSISSIKVFDKLVNCYEDYLLATKIL